MTKNEQICTLFAKYFAADDFLRRSEAKAFHCPREAQCLVDQDKEPIWSANIGAEGTPIMIVAEAPSKLEGVGPHIGGRFSDIDDIKKLSTSPIRVFKSFLKNKYHTVPYFTDLVKCGADNKKLIRKRADNCFRRFLSREIQIIEPEIILCVGNLSQSFLRECKKDGKINRSIKLIPVMHYSRQALLPLSPADKGNIIWEWQTSSRSARKTLAQMPLSKLSYFRNKPNPAQDG
jgi:uracil-DNA glycosylase